MGVVNLGLYLRRTQVLQPRFPASLPEHICVKNLFNLSVPGRDNQVVFLTN
jgi:hypothetical protein